MVRSMFVPVFVELTPTCCHASMLCQLYKDHRTGAEPVAGYSAFRGHGAGQKGPASGTGSSQRALEKTSHEMRRDIRKSTSSTPLST